MSGTFRCLLINQEESTKIVNVITIISHQWRILLFLLLTACVSASNPTTTVEDYFRALVAKESQKAIDLSCEGWKGDSIIQTDEFSMYSATLENLSCNDAGGQGNDVRWVQCTGKAILNNNGEKQAIDLSGYYQVVWQGGNWKFCGHRGD